MTISDLNISTYIPTSLFYKGHDTDMITQLDPLINCYSINN